MGTTGTITLFCLLTLRIYPDTDVLIHRHCDGPRETSTTVVVQPTSSAPAAVTTSDAHDHDDDHTDEPGTATLAPSPTESVGCEPHGDHWHCDGPATAVSTSVPATLTTAVTTAAAGTESVPAASSSIVTAAAAAVTRGVEAFGLAGLVAVVAVAL